MLKLLIVDDERVIRETISNLINWNEIGIELVGLCKDGIEAYDMIMDENPDIVLTDIKMPGLTGLDIIQRISQTDHSIEFIILSGYGEFSFAKEAMKYGVKHYLLKPCNEAQIIEIMKEVAKDCYHKHAFQDLKEQQKQLTENLHSNIIRNIITEGISSDPDIDTTLLLKPYRLFLDFLNTGYELCYLYFLKEDTLKECLKMINSYNKTNFPGIPIYSVYVKNTLVVFFQSFQSSYEEFDDFIRTLSFKNQSISIEYKRVSYDNLLNLFTNLLERLRRYGMIYYLNDFQMISLCNYNTVLKKMNPILNQLQSSDLTLYAKGLRELKDTLLPISNPDFLRTLITNLLLKRSTNTETTNPMNITEFLLDIKSIEDVTLICSMFFEKIESFFPKSSSLQPKYKDFIVKVMNYVDENLSDPNLSLKWISENYLYMNVDYVSKQFVKQTGNKFSNYLTTSRIMKAKELLVTLDANVINRTINMVGCGNNPQYFGQIFKKFTGMTPAAYLKKMRSEDSVLITSVF